MDSYRECARWDARKPVDAIFIGYRGYFREWRCSTDYAHPNPKHGLTIRIFYNSFYAASQSRCSCELCSPSAGRSH